MIMKGFFITFEDKFERKKFKFRKFDGKSSKLTENLRFLIKIHDLKIFNRN